MIKSFIYLDEQKMYSLSSQLFEGITEYVLSESSSETKGSECQKGPVGSGRVLADVIKSSSKAVEKKFLHDYSYSVFEKYLIDQNRVLSITSPIELTTIQSSINDFSFIKVNARAIFNDVEKITEFFSSFNAIGEALVNVTSYGELNKIKHQLDEIKSQILDKNKKSELDAEYKRLTNLSKLAKEGGLYQDPKFLDNLALLTKYGFSDQFEIHQNCGELLFTSCLKREYLREQEDLLVKKYSRKTEKKIVVFGLISQAFSGAESEIHDDINFPNMKAALMNMVEHLTNVENSISGKQENEVVIDPIAVYVEV